MQQQKPPVIGEGYLIQSVRLRGCPCSIYTSFEPPFVVAHVIDDDAIKVFVDFYAEFGDDWSQRPDANQLHRRAEKIACELLSDRIEQDREERRRRWRKRR